MSSVRICSAIATLACAAGLFAGETEAQSQEDSSMTVPHTVAELRQYTLHPGKRDVLIDLFDRNLVETQEAQGMWIVGEFRDLDHPDRFVWLRGFADMPARAAALNAFYSGPDWQSHRDAANETMIDSDNVLLLRPARPETWFPVVSAPLAPRTAKGAGRGLVVASIVHLRTTTPGQFSVFFEKELEPRWEQAGTSVVAQLVSDRSANNFPRLPVREGESVFVWFSIFPDPAAFDRQRRALADSADWRIVLGKLSLWTHQPIETLRLEPTARSRLHG